MILNANSILQYLFQIKNEIIKHVNLNAKIIVRAKKIIAGILAHTIDKKIHENILIYDISYKNLIGSKFGEKEIAK